MAWLKKYERRDSSNFVRIIGDRGPIELIVIHYTASHDDESAISWLCDPKSGVSSHFVIRRDGSIVQLVDTENVAFHAGRASWRGRKKINFRSIGIELCNAGCSKRSRKGFIEVEGKWWEPYPVNQMFSLELLVNDLNYYHGTISEIVGHEHISPGRKYDPGPLFPWDIFGGPPR